MGLLRTVVLVATEDMPLLDVVGPADMLKAATRMLEGPRGYRTVIATPDGQPVRGSSGLWLGADACLATLAPRGIDTLIVGSSLDFERTLAVSAVTPALQRLARVARRVCSVSTGTFLLAEAGLLEHRRATTHWAYCDELERRYPNLVVDPDRIFVKDGAVSTSAGATAAIDLALALIEEDHGPDVARSVARWSVMFMQRPGGHSQFSERLSMPTGTSTPIRELLDAIVAEPSGDHSQARLAHRAALSERHLRRLFTAEARTTPRRFVERVRVEAARTLLASSDLPVGTIARQCGFGSAETMRRAFLRVMAVGPSDYRAGVRAPEMRLAS
jgi:transcriptional regulator GlxA family with amidase domain